MPDAARQHSPLLAQVERQINLSISLSLEQKGALQQKLSSLDTAQVAQLHQIFQEEEQLKNKALSDFFTQHPEMLEEFERFVQKKVFDAYLKIETAERPLEEQKMDAVLNTF